MDRHCLVATGFLLEGQLRLSRRDVFRAALQRWPNRQVLVRIEECRDPRSVALNAYWWGVLIAQISQETGMTEDEAHEEMKALHLPRRLVAMRGPGRIVDHRVIGGTTTNLSNDEQWDVIERTFHWAATTLDLVLPYPNDGVVAA